MRDANYLWDATLVGEYTICAVGAQGVTSASVVTVTVGEVAHVCTRHLPQAMNPEMGQTWNQHKLLQTLKSTLWLKFGLWTQMATNTKPVPSLGPVLPMDLLPNNTFVMPIQTLLEIGLSFLWQDQPSVHSHLQCRHLALAQALGTLPWITDRCRNYLQLPVRPDPRGRLSGG